MSVDFIDDDAAGEGWLPEVSRDVLAGVLRVIEPVPQSRRKVAYKFQYQRPRIADMT